MRWRGKERERFTADGALVTQTDKLDRPIEAKKVRYITKGQADQITALQQQTTDEVVRFEYSSAQDRLARPKGPP